MGFISSGAPNVTVLQLTEMVCSEQSYDRLKFEARNGGNLRSELIKCVVSLINGFIHVELYRQLLYSSLLSGAIFTDWNHTREWKASGKKSFLQTEILSQQNRED